MEKIYNPESIEKQWYRFWEESGFFKPQKKGTPYCIMLPPPNVTGSLHMGHAFQDTLMDALIRYHRMLGDTTLWQGGTDHAGIATQMVVERQLNIKGISRHDLGREAFTEKVWAWKHESGNTITQQMRRLGASIDWSRERFTMDEGLSNAVKEVFVRLYDEGLIYKGKRLVNWDPKLHTAVSDLEVLSTEEEGSLWHIRYPIEGEKTTLVVATTRPETMLGDMAVAVHPEDPRYKHLIGKMVLLPLTNRKIPIIADDYVDPAFGTGCVKITPAHDFNDHEVGKRHNLPLLNIFDNNAHLNENAPAPYQGLERFEARAKMVNDLDALGLMEKIEPHTLKVPRGDRSGVIIEPYLTDQWFVKVEPLAKPAIEAVASGKIKFVPENWSKTYFEWMNNLQDWCISRQLWWGHRIPAWTDEQGNLYVARDEEEVRTKYKLDKSVVLTQESDVLDTWFSSALWPFSTLGWPENTPELKDFYPTNVLVTGFDIIFFWVARMIMMGLKFTGLPPFKTVFVHGLIQDAEGQKMSKSKGNILDPLDLIDGIDLKTLVEKRTKGLMQPEMAKKIENQTKKHFPEGIPSFGTDALRFTFLALATTGRHIRFDLNRVEGYRNFCNKIWNATRYVLMNGEGKDLGESKKDRTYSLADQWIWSKLQTLKQEVRKHIDEYRFDLVASSLYEFIWNTYCDWYLELSKSVLNDENASPSLQNGTRYTLVAVLEELICILHPFMPFITEEIWQRLKGFVGKENQTTVMLEPYPVVDAALVNSDAEASLEWIKSFITAIRNIRGEMNLSPGKVLSCLAFGGSNREQTTLKQQTPWIKSLAKLDAIDILESKDNLPMVASQIAGDMELYIPLKGLIDIEVESGRLKKEIEKHQKEKVKSESKLNNEKFVSSAPKDVVDEEKRRLDEALSAIQKLNGQLEKLQGLQ